MLLGFLVTNSLRKRLKPRAPRVAADVSAWPAGHQSFQAVSRSAKHRSPVGAGTHTPVPSGSPRLGGQHPRRSTRTWERLIWRCGRRVEQRRPEALGSTLESWLGRASEQRSAQVAVARTDELIW